MLAARIHEDGGPEVLVVEEVPDPVAGPGEVLVRLEAASLNHLDVWVRKGLPSVPKPRILGADGAGVVEALGDGVDRPRRGRPGRAQPGCRARRQDHRRRRALRRHARGADRDRRRTGLPARRRALVRGRSSVPARLRDGPPDARHACERAGGRVGADLGDRGRRRHGRFRDLPGARRAHDRHLRQRRQARSRRSRGERTSS